MKHYLIYTMVLLLSFVGINNLNAAPELLIPVWTKHIYHEVDEGYIEGFDNQSIGLNWSFDHIDLGAAYVMTNSLGNKSIFGYGLVYGNVGPVKVGGGLFLARGGYEAPMLGSPVMAVRYGWVRVISTYPFGAMTESKFDLINVQLLIPLEF